MIRGFGKLMASVAAVFFVCFIFALMKYAVLAQPKENGNHSPEVQKLLDDFEQDLQRLQRIPS